MERDGHGRVVGDVAADDFGGAVGGGVVDDNDLVGNRGLRAGGGDDIEGAFDIAGLVIARDEERD